MATEAEALLGALGIQLAWCLGLLAAFSIARILPLTKRFCQPLRYATTAKSPKPRRIANKLLAWARAAATCPSQALVHHASTDAALYALLVRLGLQLFAGVTLISFLLVLPVNATGGETARQSLPAATSSFTYWLSSPGLTATSNSNGNKASIRLDSAPPKVVQVCQEL